MRGDNMSKNSKIIIKNRRCVFPNLDEAKAFVEGQEGKYNIKLLIPKDDKEFVSNFKEWIKEQIEATDWSKTQKSQVFKTAFDSDNGYNDNCVLKDGDHLNQRRKDEDKETYEFYSGHYVVSANRKGSFGPPLVVYPTRETIPTHLIKSEIVSGYYVNVQIGSYCYSKPKAGVSIQLLAVQKVKEAEVFGRENPFDELEVLEVADNSVEEVNPFA